MATTVGIPSALLGSSLEVPTYVDNVTLATSTNETWTVPANVNFILLSADGGFYVRAGSGNTADETPGDISNGTGSFYVPSSAQFKVNEGKVLNFIAAGARVISIGCYSRSSQ